MTDEMDLRFLSDRSRIGYQVQAAAERIARRRMFADLSHADREDLVGITIAKFYRRWGPRDRPADIEAYLARTMYHALMDLYRERRLLPQPVAPDGSRSVESVLQGWMPPVRSLSTPVVQQHAVSEFYRQLSPDDARLLWLKAEGYSSREIGEFLGLRPNAVYVRLHRLRQRLHELVDPEAEDGTAFGFRAGSGA